MLDDSAVTNSTCFKISHFENTMSQKQIRNFENSYHLEYFMDRYESNST